MKSKTTVLSAAVFVCVFFAGMKALGQCINAPDTLDFKRGYREVKLDPEPDAEEAKRRATVKKKVYTHVYVFLRDTQRFKVKLDGEHTGDFSKTNDLIPFTVLENVYGYANVPSAVWVPNLPDPEDEEKLGKTTVNAAFANKDKPVVVGHWKTTVTEMKCLLIPVNSKIYGMVDHANSRYPFNIKRKGKLFVTLNKIKLESGDEINLKFADAVEQGKPDPNVAAKPVVRGCRRFKDRPCITGRRTKFSFPAAVFGDTTTAGILIAQDEEDKISETIGFFSIIGALSKAANLEGYINPPNAALKAGMVFEVMTESPTGAWPGGWVPIAKPPAKEDK